MINIFFLLFALATMFFLIRFLFKINRNKSFNGISNDNIDSAQKIDLKSSPIAPAKSIKINKQPITKQNSFLNSNDDFGKMKKGVVLENQTYEYEVNENDICNFNIIEPVVESKDISE